MLFSLYLFPFSLNVELRGVLIIVDLRGGNE